jgi:hypothetical protein
MPMGGCTDRSWLTGKGVTGRCLKCANGSGHGPYWYRYHWYESKMHKRYVGKQLRLSVDRLGVRVEVRSARPV